MTKADSVPERDLISRRIAELNSESMRLQKQLLDVVQEEYGLVRGVTRVSQDGMTGTFLEVLNYKEPGPPWLRVRLDQHSDVSRRSLIHFYGKWEKVT